MSLTDIAALSNEPNMLTRLTLPTLQEYFKYCLPPRAILTVYSLQLFGRVNCEALGFS
jgi:hypothetical protein